MDKYTTEELVEELCNRQGVEACWVEPEWILEVVVETTRPHPKYPGIGEHLTGEMHDGKMRGPAWVLVITD